jgi:hypothetical protein
MRRSHVQGFSREWDFVNVFLGGCAGTAWSAAQGRRQRKPLETPPIVRRDDQYGSSGQEISNLHTFILQPGGQLQQGRRRSAMQDLQQIPAILPASGRFAGPRLALELLADKAQNGPQKCFLIWA